MRIVPKRSIWLQLATLLAAMLLGPAGALRLALQLAPGSDLVHLASVLAFGTIFIGGLLAWMGIGIVTVGAALLASLARHPRGGSRGPLLPERAVPPGYRAFAALGALLGGAVGLFAGVFTDLPVVLATTVWGAAGLAYGAALSMAAWAGYLPFPEPE